MRDINKIIVHHAYTPDGKHFDANNIRDWHLNRGWSDIGYHFVILLDGTVETGRPIDRAGAHTVGQNKDSIGICLIGTLKFTDSQIKSLASLMLKLSDKYSIKLDHIYAHNEFADKDCPGMGGSVLRQLAKMASLCRQLEAHLSSASS